LTRAAVFILFALLLAVPVASVYAQGVPSKQEILDVNYSGPVFQDAFWTDRTMPPPEGTSLNKVEVGPGDGASVLAVVFVNRGLSQITSVTGTLNLPAGMTASGGGSQAVAKQNTIVAPGATFTLFFEVDVSKSARVQGYNAQLTVQYSKILEVGQYRTADLLAQFRLTGKAVLDAEAVNREIVPGSANPVSITVSNKGTAAATGVVVTVSATASGANGSSGMSAVTVGQKTFDVGSIPANGTAEIRPTIYASSAGETSQSINLQVSYGNAYGVKTSTNIQVGLVVLPRALESDLSVAPAGNSSSIITAGKIFDYKFAVSNVAGKPLSNVLITLTSQTDSIKILGDSKWTVKSMDANYDKEFSTQVFAPIDAIGKSTTFNLNLQYLSEGQTKTDSVDLGSYVDGEISIRAYEIDVNYIGGTPNLVGNLLNEGNTLAMFTTIEVTGADNLVSTLPPQQYLGDLEENSPLPFSIPIDVGSTGAGTYPVSLKITYKDNLRQLHTLDINTQVKFAPEQPTTESQAPSFNPAIPVGIGIAVVIAIIIVVIIRRRKKSTLKRTITENKHDDIESLLDSQRLKTDERK
jgi:hypothetical protein